MSKRSWGGASLWTMMGRVGRRGVSWEGTELWTDVPETLSMRAHLSDTIQSSDAKRHGMGKNPPRNASQPARIHHVPIAAQHNARRPAPIDPAASNAMKNALPANQHNSMPPTAVPWESPQRKQVSK